MLVYINGTHVTENGVAAPNVVIIYPLQKNSNRQGNHQSIGTVSDLITKQHKTCLGRNSL